MIFKVVNLMFITDVTIIKFGVTKVFIELFFNSTSKFRFSKLTLKTRIGTNSFYFLTVCESNIQQDVVNNFM